MTQLIAAVSRIRALESELLTSAHLERLITAHDFNEAYSVLEDLGWAEEASYFKDTKDFEGVMEVGMASSRDIFTSFQIPEVFSVLTVLWDIQNVKTTIKAFTQGQSKEDIQELLLGYGSFSINDIVHAVYEENTLPVLLPMIIKAKAIVKNTEMEVYIELQMLSRAKANAQGDLFLYNYLQKIEALLRLRSDALTISLSELREKYPLYKEIIDRSVEEETLNIDILEYLADEIVINFLKAESMGSIENYAPLFSYYWRKERNSRLIRSILLAKKAGISIEEIKSEFIKLIV